jgi:hypothetical protein
MLPPKNVNVGVKTVSQRGAKPRWVPEMLGWKLSPKSSQHLGGHQKCWGWDNTQKCWGENRLPKRSKHS